MVSEWLKTVRPVLRSGGVVLVRLEHGRAVAGVAMDDERSGVETHVIPAKATQNLTTPTVRPMSKIITTIFVF